MRESHNGQYVETLGNQPSLRAHNNASSKPVYKVGETRPPTLVEVMLDPEFLSEFRGNNEDLHAFMDMEKMLEVADYVIQEPKFSDSPERCF